LARPGLLRSIGSIFMSMVGLITTSSPPKKTIIIKR
jgi:hypothetical protein